MTSGSAEITTPSPYTRPAVEPKQSDGWSPLERFAFRFVFVYFGMFFVASLLDVGNGPRKLLAQLSVPPVRWFAHMVFDLEGAPSLGGARWAASQQIVAFGIAALAAGAWSLVAHRTEYRRLRGWFFIALRYYVAIVMLVYGGFKVVDSQFPPLSLEQVTQPLGTLAPMGLLWAFMGYSVIYTTFTGLGETVGAFLLFFRRTTTAGALVLIAVLSNVALLNYTFDVPVKQLSSNLLFASIVLAAADAKRVVDVFVRNRPVATQDQSFDFRRPWIYKTRRVLKPLIVVLATCAPLGISIAVHSRLVAIPPLYGVYDVEQYARNGVATLPLATDGSRWRQVTFGRGGALVRMMNDSSRTYIVTVDSTQHRIVWRPRASGGATVTYDYETLTDGLRLRGQDGTDSIDVTLRRLDHERAFRLLRRR